MNCQEAREAFSAYHDGALPPETASPVSAHLAGCGTCRAEWEAYRRTMRMLSAAGSPVEPPGLSGRVERAWRSAPEGRDAWRWMALAAVFLFGLLVGLAAMRGCKR